jgi:hypothetical protein
MTLLSTRALAKHEPYSCRLRASGGFFAK